MPAESYDDAIKHLDDQAFPHAAEALRKHRDSLSQPQLPAEIWGLWSPSAKRWYVGATCHVWFRSREAAEKATLQPGWQTVLLNPPAPAPAPDVDVEGILERLMRNDNIAGKAATGHDVYSCRFYDGAASALNSALNAIAAARKEAAK